MVTCTADWACILLQIKGGAMTLKSTRGRQGQMVLCQKGEECWRYLIEEKESAPNICRSWCVGSHGTTRPAVGDPSRPQHSPRASICKMNLIMKCIALAVYSVS